MNNTNGVFIAIPATNIGITPAGAMSVLCNTHVLRDMGYKVTPYFNEQCNFIDKARNICVELFLSTNCSDIIFVDADEGYDQDAMAKVLKYDKDIVAGAVPVKDNTVSYCINPVFNNGNCICASTGLVRIDRAGTGFMRIQRRVFDKLIDHYGMTRNSDGLYEFFKTGGMSTINDFAKLLLNDKCSTPLTEKIEVAKKKMESTDRWYGEDVYFCKRWIDAGGEMFVDPTITFSHVGVKMYTGNYYDYLTEFEIKM